jgi:hypothetical protein
MLLRSTLLTAVLLVSWTLAAPALADTPVPLCNGHNPAVAATAKAEGLRHYRASKREGPGDPEMATALGFLDASCAAGDDTALELRAYTLAAVERFVEAAKTLDAFLAAHPLDTLPPATRERLAAQQPAILTRVASLSVESPTAGAQVFINHQLAGLTPLHSVRLAPGRYDIEVAVEGGAPMARTVDLAAGERTETFTSPVAFVPVDAKAARTAPREQAPARSPTQPSLRPWAVGTGIGALVLLVGGGAGAIWANERSSLYDTNNCATVPKVGCSTALSEYHAAQGIEVAGFVGGGLAAVASGLLFYLDRGQRSASPLPASAGSVSCRIPGMAVACIVRF